MNRFLKEDQCYELEQAVDVFLTSKNKEPLIKSLNKIFSVPCKDVIYNYNTDRIFFGMTVMPILKDDEVIKLIDGDKDDIKVSCYYLEIDSKLVSLVGLDTKEITACLLHEIGHVASDAASIDKVKKSLDLYFAKTNTSLDLRQSKNYLQFLKIGIEDSIRKAYSMFYRKDPEMIADEFVVACGYGKELEEAYRKINKSTSKFRMNDGKFTILRWVLGMYTSMDHSRINALKILNKSFSIESSELQKRNIKIMIRDIDTIKEDAVQESFKSFIQDRLKSLKYRDLNELDSELYEYTLRIKAVDDQTEALDILRELNTRVSLLSDYISSQSLDETDRKKCINLYNKYIMIREKLSNKVTYKEKYYGLFVQTPVVKSRYQI